MKPQGTQLAFTRWPSRWAEQVIWAARVAIHHQETGSDLPCRDGGRARVWEGRTCSWGHYHTHFYRKRRWTRCLIYASFFKKWTVLFKMQHLDMLQSGPSQGPRLSLPCRAQDTMRPSPGAGAGCLPRQPRTGIPNRQVKPHHKQRGSRRQPPNPQQTGARARAGPRGTCSGLLWDKPRQVALEVWVMRTDHAGAPLVTGSTKRTRIWILGHAGSEMSRSQARGGRWWVTHRLPLASAICPPLGQLIRTWP